MGSTLAYNDGVTAFLHDFWASGFVSRARITCVAGLVCVVGLVACVPSTSQPTLLSVSPDWGFNGEENLVELLGEGFLPAVRGTGSGEVILDRRHRVWLVGEGGVSTELGGVASLSYEIIQAQVPAGLAVGSYGMRVEGPAGQGASIANAYTVTDTRADHLAVTLDEIVYPVGSYALIPIQVLDPDDELVPMPLELQVTVESQTTGVIFADSLDVQIDIDGGIQGSLAESGQGFVALTSTVPDEFWVNIAPTDPGSVIREVRQFLAFTPGEVAHISVSLPEPDFHTEAGVGFNVDLTLLDGEGFPTQGQVAALLISERCGAGTRTETVIDQAQISFVAQGATTADCPENHVEVVGTSGGSFLEGESEAFTVAPGPIAHLAVASQPAQVQAGTGVGDLWVRAEDAHGNTVVDFGDELELADDHGGLDLATGVGEQACSTFSGGEASCEARLWRAGEAVTIEVEASPSGATGQADPIEVIPGPVLNVQVGLPDAGAGDVLAGASFPVLVAALDAYSNQILINPEGAGAPLLADQLGGGGSMSCAWDGTSTLPLAYGCIAIGAEEAKRVIGVVQGVMGQSAPFSVVNGELAWVEMDLDMSPVVAGESFTITAAGLDAWGNAYVVQHSGSGLSLGDFSGTLSLGTVALGPDGLATWPGGEITAAWVDDEITAYGATGKVGVTDPFDVVAAAAETFRMEPTRPWVWTGDALAFQVAAVDPWGNVVTDYGGTVSLTSELGLAAAQELSAFEDGEATVAVSYTGVGLVDHLLADDGSHTGTSDPVDVLDPDCSSPPTASLLVDGSLVEVLCLGGSGSTATSIISAASSVAGDGEIRAAHLDMGEGEWMRVTSLAAGHAWVEEGLYLPQGVVVDEYACGDVASAMVHVAQDDGQPAGPVGVSTDVASLVALESGSGGETTVTVSAQDCTGDPSMAGILLVRADLGDLGAGPTSSGAGLELGLDAAGMASFSWSSAATAHGGTATLHVGVVSGAALGKSTVEILGDASAPTVWSVDPVGHRTDTVSTLRIGFSEPMLASLVPTSLVELVDPDGEQVALSGSTLDGATLTIDLVSPANLGLGTWTLVISGAFRDEAGNWLDGDGTGAPSDLVLEVGAGVPVSAPDLVSCTLDRAGFRPDGDPGVGWEADGVNIDLIADGPAAAWRLTVEDADGNVRHVVRHLGGGAVGSLLWDGRAADGAVVANGTYRLVVEALDDDWNAGAACEVDVDVDNWIEVRL